MSGINRRNFLETGFKAAAVTGFGVLGGSFVAGCGGSESSASEAGGVLETLKKQGSARLGIANEKPYGYEEAGKASGLVVDIVTAMLAPLGISKIVPVTGTFDSLIPGVAAKHFDLIGAGTYIKPERCVAVAFTNPIYRVGASFLVKKGNPLDLHGLADVAANEKARIASQTGSSQVAEIQGAKITKSQTQLFTTDQQALAALLGDRVDAVYFPSIQISALFETAKSDAIERVADFNQIEGPDGKPQFNYGSVPCRKEDTDLVSGLNASLREIRDSGELLKILQKWGLTDEEMPPADVTSKALCA